MDTRYLKKITVTLDTNILIAATFWNDPSWRILEAISHGIYIHRSSWKILEEYKKILLSDELVHKDKKKNVKNITAFFKILDCTQIVFPTKSFFLVQEDPEDNKILECAYEAKADYIISYDKHLRKIGIFEEIKIVTPEEFIQQLKIGEESFK